MGNIITKSRITTLLGHHAAQVLRAVLGVEVVAGRELFFAGGRPFAVPRRPATTVGMGVPVLSRRLIAELNRY